MRGNGLKIQRYRIVQSLHSIDQIGVHLWQRQQRKAKVAWQTYKVSRPNALWHMDGHHRLIRWGFVIHGIVDGYSRKVCYLNAFSISIFIFK
jgi:hypothetical protein